MGLGKKGLSAVILILLIAMVGAAVLSGVLSAKVGQGNVRTVSVEITDPLYGPASLGSLNLTYSSVGLHVVTASGSSWYYYNASGALDLLKLQNYTYTMAQFGLPDNSSIDGASLLLVGTNLTLHGAPAGAFLTNRTLYTGITASQAEANASQILLELSPSVIPVQNRSGLLFAISPKLTAGAGSGMGLTVGSFTAINTSLRASLQAGEGRVSITSAQITEGAYSTGVSVELKNNGNSAARVGPLIIIGNFSVNRVTNASALLSVLSGLGSGGLNSTGSAIANLSSSINTSELNSIMQKLPQGMRANLSNAAGNTSSGIKSEIGGILGRVNGSVLSGVESQLHVGSLASLFNLSSLGSLGAGEIQSLINRFANSSVEASIVSGVLQGQYNQYIGKAVALNNQEHSLDAVALLAESNGTLVPASSGAQLNAQEWMVLQPGQSATLSFNGMLTSTGSGFFGAVTNNTYKIILSGDNSTLYVTAH